MRAVKSVSIDSERRVIITYLDGSTETLFPEQIDYDEAIIALQEEIGELKENITNLQTGKQDALTFDQVPTDESTNPVTSVGIKNAIEAAVDVTAPCIYETASGSIASYTDGADNLPLKSCVVNMEPIQAGSGDPSPENVRLISGRTELSVVRSGKNLLDTTLYDGISYNPTIGSTVSPIESTDVLTDKGDGEFQLSFTSTWKIRSFIVPVVKDISYHVYCKFTTDSNVATSYGLLDENYTVLSCYNEGYAAAGSIAKNLTFGTTALPSDRGYFYLLFTNRTAENAVIDISKPQLELGSTATDYEPYQGETVSVNWETEAGTVYGGYVDVVSGKLVVDRAILTEDGSSNIYASQANKFYVTKANAIQVNSTNQLTERSVICDKMKSVSWAGAADGNWVCAPLYGKGYAFAANEFTTAEAWKQYFAENPTQFSYKLNTPIEIQLTPQEVRTLLGENNIWSDGGDMEVEYPADTKIYIDTKIAETVAAAME